MAREGISKAQVFNAADAISAAGQNPTVAGVRAKIGTGSFTTITAFLREWKEQSMAQELADDLDIPEEVTAALSRAAEIVWKSANEHFARELTTLRKEADAHTLAAQAEAVEAVREIEELEKRVNGYEKHTEDLNARIIELDNFIQDKLRHIAALTSELAELRAQLKAADARIAEQSALLLRLVPEKKTDPKPKRTARKVSEPVPDTLTQPLTL